MLNPLSCSEHGGELIVGEDGMIVAAMWVAPPTPWEIRESIRYPGRFFFFNLVDETSAWKLPASLWSSPLQMQTDPDAPASLSPKKMSSESVQHKRSMPSPSSMSNLFSFTSMRRRSVASSTSETKESKDTSSLYFNHRPFAASKANKSAIELSAEAKGEYGTDVHRGTRLSGDRDTNMLGAHEFKSDEPGSPLSHGAHLLRVVAGLGMGGHAVVVQVEEEESGGAYAMKVVHKESSVSRKDLEHLRNELKIMTETQPSPFLQRCHVAFESDTDLYFVIDYFAGGDLFSHLVERVKSTGGGFAEREARALLAEIVLGLEHLHHRGFVHRDIKAENIMLDASGHVKLVDFGLAVPISKPEEPMSATGSLIYMAPEMIRQHMGGRHTDWWAVGVLAHELLTGYTPWSSLTDKRVIRREILGMNVSPPRVISPQAGHFVCGLLRQDFHNRLGTKDDAEVRAASFFSSVDWDATARQEASPALVPSGALSESEAIQRQEALKQYLDHLPPQVVAQWRLSRDMTDASMRPRRRWWQKRPSFLWANQ